MMPTDIQAVTVFRAMPSAALSCCARIGRSSRQSGGVLFVALSILIVVTLLGLSAARVTGLQERLAGVYRADNQAFFNADGLLRDGEKQVLTGDSESCIYIDVGDPIPPEWLDGSVTTNASIIENISSGSAQGGVSLELGGPNCNFFRVSVLAWDAQGAGQATSRAVLQAIYVP